MNDVTLSVDLENCYGIKKIEHTFSFTDNNRVYAIYAQNGLMKTSFAKTFEDLQASKQPQDMLNPETTAIATVNWNSNPISSESIYVIRDYRDAVEYHKVVADLMLDPKLKKEYDKLTKDYMDCKKKFEDTEK